MISESLLQHVKRTLARGSRDVNRFPKNTESYRKILRLRLTHPSTLFGAVKASRLTSHRALIAVSIMQYPKAFVSAAW